MRDAGAASVWLTIAGLGVSHVAAWWFLWRRMDARVRALAERRRRLTDLIDGLLQDVQGLALSLQALAGPLAEADPTRLGIERILDHIDELLARGHKDAQGDATG